MQSSSSPIHFLALLLHSVSLDASHLVLTLLFLHSSCTLPYAFCCCCCDCCCCAVVLHHKEGGIDARPECTGLVNSLTSPTRDRTPILHLYLISGDPEYGTHPRGKGGRFSVPIWEQWEPGAKDHQETMRTECLRALQKAKIKGRRFLAPLDLSLRIYSNAKNSLADLLVTL